MKSSDKKELVVKLSLSLTSGKGGGPNLSTLLGFWGIGLGIFKKEFDKYIEGLPGYFKSILDIYYYMDRSIKLVYNFYSLSFLFRLCSSQSTIKVKGPGGFVSKSIDVLKLSRFLEIIVLNFGGLSDINLKQGYGTLCSMSISLVNDYVQK